MKMADITSEVRATVLRDAADDADAFSRDRSKPTASRVCLRVAARWLRAKADHIEKVLS